MSADVAAPVLPDGKEEGKEEEVRSPFDPNLPEDPRHSEWIKQSGHATRVAYNYAAYNMTEAERRAAEGEGPILAPGDVLQDEGWANNATVYEWCDEYGDVGPAHPVLEKQLFGSDVHVTTGIDFSGVTSINVVQEGTIRIKPVLSFDDAGLHPVMLANVRLAGYTVPTPVQCYTLPAIFKGHDIVACAQTGSGKTGAFLIPTLSKLMGKAKKLCAPRPNPATFVPDPRNFARAEPLMLIVCPNRELAVQIFNEARRFCYRSMLRPCVVYGGGPRRDQLNQIAKGCDVLIGTPGRLVDFITNEPERLSLCRLKYMIVDEADEMLSPDWEDEFKVIMNGGDQEDGNITYMMFSATFPKAARDLAKEHLANDFVRIRVGRAGSTSTNIEQNVIYVEPSAKRQALLDLLYSRPPARTIVFVNSKRSADELDDYLYNIGMPSTSIHSDRTQREREDAIRSFRIGAVGILVATGVSARGLDIKNVMHVINFDLPNADFGGIEEYTHRIGRTARIGNRGLATSFYCDRNEDLALDLVKTLSETNQPIPDFLQAFVPEGGAAELEFEVDSDFGGDDAEEAAAPVADKLIDVLADNVSKNLAMNTPTAPRFLPGMKPRDPNAQPDQKVVAPAAPAVLEPINPNVPCVSGIDIKGKGKEIEVPIPTVTVTAPSVTAADEDDDW
ncbi:hypothetical protein VE02_03918 [Pseudogymnoascus sp. 03VT05]|nr:hypothetical protein VE02_03918 [Pseudogymnoascus sp. 03VT05]